jgi:hypothetical protein
MLGDDSQVDQSGAERRACRPPPDHRPARHPLAPGTNEVSLRVLQHSVDQRERFACAEVRLRGPLTLAGCGTVASFARSCRTDGRTLTTRRRRRDLQRRVVRS